MQKVSWFFARNVFGAMVRLFSLVLILQIFNFYLAKPAFAITPIVTTSSTTAATQPSTMRNLVLTSDGTLHTFVQMGTNTTKCSSGGLWWLHSVDDGVTWTCGSQLSSDTTNLMYVDAKADTSDNLYVVYSVGTTGRNNAYDIFYRKIGYNGSSSWTVNSSQTVLDGSAAATGYHYSTIVLQGTTRAWIASRYYDGTNYGVTVYYSDSLGTAPTWTQSLATADTAGTNALYHYPTLVRFGSKIGLIYNIESGSDLAWRYRADSDGLTTWNAQATISTSFLVRGATFSADGDSTGNIYLGASGSTTLFTHYLSSWSTPATVSSTVVSDQYISVSTDGISAWVVYGDTSGVIGGVNKRLAFKKVVSPFATANFDTSPTYPVSYHGIFDKVWLYDASANTYEDETTDAGDTGTADIAHSSSSSYVKDVGDIAYLGKSTTFDAADWESSTIGTGSGTIVWEYCSAADGSGNCTTWSTLTFTASSQPNFKGTSGYGAFTSPSDWAAAKINSESTAYYYIRARTSVAYTVGPVGSEFFAVPPTSWGSLAASTAGVYGVWTENSASVTKVRYSNMVTFSSAPYEPTSLGGHVTGATTSDNTPSLSFTLSDPGVSDTVKFQIQIDDTSNFSSSVIDYTSALAAQGSATFTVGQAAGSGTYTSGSPGQTLSDGSYYWRVKAIDNNSEESDYVSANSGAIAFVVDVNAVPINWPMAGANPERTSWTSETLPGDIAAEWVKPIEPYISQHVQVIGAEDNVYVATAKGLYAFDASSGTETWVYPTELPLGHSPTYASGVLYVGGLDRRMHAVNATTGALVWTYEAGGGFSTSPVVANGMVYAGNRDGLFYAINVADGTLAWSYETGNQILQSAAFKAEDDGIVGTSGGTLYFASNDGYAYALNAQSGALVWRSASKLPSNGFYSWWPVIYEDDVIFTRSTFGSGHTGEETDYLLCTPPVAPAERPVGCTPSSSWTTGLIGTEIGDWVSGTATLDLNSNSYGITYADYFETFPEYRNQIFYNLVSGSERNFDIDGDSVTDAAPVGWAGDGGTPSPPIVSGFDNVLYFRTYTRGGGGFGSKTIAGWKVGTGIISVPFSSVSGQSGSWPGDEPNGMTAAGNKIYWNHCCDRYVGAVDISQPNTDFLLNTDDGDRTWRYVNSGGIPFYPFTNIGLPSDYYTSAIPYFWDPPDPAVFWNENDKVGPSAYNGRLYMILGNALVAMGESGLGTSAPKLSTAASASASTLASSITSTELTAKLETEVQEIVDAGHLMPSFFFSGNITSFRMRNLDDYLSHYWHNPAETQIILLRALPYLSAGLQTELRTYLQSELTNYSPATYSHMGFVAGTQRDPYPYPPLEDVFNSFTATSIDKQTSSSFNNFWSFPPYNVYALWKYAEAGLGNASTLLTAWGTTKLKTPIENNFSSINGETVNSGNIQALMKSFPLLSNAYIAAYQGYIGLATLAGQSTTAYQTELDKLLAWKLEDLMTYPDPQEPYFCDSECYYESLITYYNFAYLTPELATHLRENAISVDPEKDILSILQEYQDIAPYWMQAHNGETQGESAIQPYQQTHSLFQALARVKEATYEELIKYLDTPIVPVGDLYYIDNVVATLEAPESSPSPSPSPSPTPTPEPSPTPTPDPSPTPTPDPSPTPTPTPSPEPSPEPSPTPTPEPSPTPTATPTAPPGPTPESTSNTSSSSTSSSDPSTECRDIIPSGLTPWLYEAHANSSSSITLKFANWQSPATHLGLEYGTESGVYTYAVATIGNQDTNTYTINSLNSNTEYYFRVRSFNGCAPGSWGNELSAKTLKLFEQNISVPTSFLLETIRQEDMEEEVLDPSEEPSETTNIAKSIVDNEIALPGYSVNVRVLDVNQRPVEGATVTIHSEPMTATTDKDGIARFSGVERGDHKVFIAYEGYEGEQSINLTGDATEFDLNITIEQKNVLLDPKVISIGSILILIIIALVIALIRKGKT